MPKPQDIFQLARQEAVRVTASPQAWQSFLYTAAHNYHTTYLNQLLIHAQRPDAAACASMEYWNTGIRRQTGWSCAAARALLCCSADRAWR